MQKILHRPVQVVCDITVRPAQNQIALYFQQPIPLHIARDVFRQCVLIAVKFNDNAMHVFNKIENVGAKWRLPAEVIAKLVHISQLPPQLLFRNSRVPAQLASGCDRPLAWLCLHRSPTRKSYAFSTSPQVGGVGVDGPCTASLCQDEVVEDLKQRKPSVEQIIRIGMDTSKQVFQLHGVNAAEEPVLRRK
ncbi:MAG TPA: hypothetical protein VIJ85_00700, partial [Rhizomicrobium sp.]